MPRIVTQLDLDLEKLRIRRQEAKNEWRQMAKDAGDTKIGANLFSDLQGKVAMMAGGGLIGGAIKKMFSDVDDLADISISLGETPETIQRVGTAAKLSGSSVEGLANGMLKLERSLGDVENAKGRKALERYGLTAEKLMAMPLDQKLIALASAFQKARQDGTGLADLQAMLGRGAAELIPLLSSTGDELRAMFEGTDVLANDTVFAMAALNDQFDLLITNAATGAKQATMELVKLTQAALAGAEALAGRTLGVGNPNALHDLDEKWQKSREDSEKRITDMQAARAARAAGIATRVGAGGEESTQKRIDALQAEIEKQRIDSLSPAMKAAAIGSQLKTMLRSANAADPTMSGLDVSINSTTDLKEKERLLKIKKQAQDAQKQLADLVPKEQAQAQYQQLGAFGKAGAFFSGANPNELVAVEAQKQTQQGVENNKLLADIKTILAEIKGRDAKLVVNPAVFPR